MLSTARLLSGSVSSPYATVQLTPRQCPTALWESRQQGKYHLHWQRQVGKNLCPAWASRKFGAQTSLHLQSRDGPLCSPATPRRIVCRAEAADAVDMAPSKSIAVVGAGLSGLVAAKSLLERGLLPTVFDAAEKVGGMWNPEAHPGCQRWPSMRTNVSRFTCSFSDLLWPPGSPTFPSQPEVGRYLVRYAARFLSQPGVTFSLGSRVTRVAPRPDGLWDVHWQVTDASGNREQQRAVFAGVVVASGFFAAPRLPPLPPPSRGAATFQGTLLHANDYRGATGVHAAPFAGKRVAVVGASLSAVEIAADIAVSGRAASVTNVVPHHAYVLPRLLPDDTGSAAPAFLPLDLLLYQRKEPGKGGAQLGKGVAGQGGGEEGAEEGAEAAHAYFGRILPREEDVLAALKHKEGDVPPPPYVGICDHYAGLVRGGAITLLPGRMVGVAEDGRALLVDATPAPAAANSTTATSPPSPPVHLDVDTVIFCTGFGPSLDFLQPAPSHADKPGEPTASAADAVDPLVPLAYDPDDPLLPLLLDADSVFHPTLHGLAFVGMYRGVFPGVVELQARLVADVFAGAIPHPYANDKGAAAASLSRAQALRDTHPRPQFPFKYVEHADVLAARIGALPPASWPLATNYPVTPLQYRMAVGDAGAQPRREMAFAGLGEARTADVPFLATQPTRAPSPLSLGEAFRDLEDELAAYRAGKGVARAVFRGLGGKWCFRRRLVSRLDASPSGVVVGEASFKPQPWPLMAEAWVVEPPAETASGQGDAPVAGQGRAWDVLKPSWSAHEDPVVAREQAAMPACAATGAGTGGVSGRGATAANPVLDYLYQETGVFRTSSGLELNVKSSYVYTQEGEGDTLELFFAAPPGAQATNRDPRIVQGDQGPIMVRGRPFLSLRPSRADPGSGWEADATHLCGADTYVARFRFAFEGARLREMEIHFHVSGPHKDYDSVTLMRRGPVSELAFQQGISFADALE
eukprot:jgi/Mesvir1/12600/Mv17927-RA.1